MDSTGRRMRDHALRSIGSNLTIDRARELTAALETIGDWRREFVHDAYYVTLDGESRIATIESDDDVDLHVHMAFSEFAEVVRDYTTSIEQHPADFLDRWCQAQGTSAGGPRASLSIREERRCWVLEVDLDGTPLEGVSGRSTLRSESSDGHCYVAEASGTGALVELLSQFRHFAGYIAHT